MGKTKNRRSRRLPIVVPRPNPNAPPGTVTPSANAAGSGLDIIAFTPDRLEEQQAEGLDDLRRSREGKSRVLWVNVEGVEDTSRLMALGDELGLHPLALEDSTHLHQRPKAEAYTDHGYVVLQMPSGEDRTQQFEQFSLFFGKDYVVTIQEGVPGDCLDPLRKRLREARGKVRQRGADYLAYSIVDAIIDSYFPIVERLNERIEGLEDVVLDRGGDDVLSEIHATRHELHTLRRMLASSREAIGVLMRGEAGPVTDSTVPFLRDCHDHTAQLLDAIEALQVLVSGLMDLYHAENASRMNEVMKLLTIIATIFIPLSFIAGVYGMNFDREASDWNMPELGWTLGYPFALVLMLGTSGAFVLYFVRRGWLGRPRRPTARSDERRLS